MTRKTREIGLEMKEEINTREQELKELLHRVMGAPLMPMQEEMKGIRERMDSLEKACDEMRATSDQTGLHVVDIHKETNKLKSTIEGIKQSAGNAAESLDELLGQSAGLASSQSGTQEGLSRLEEQLTSQHRQLASQQVTIESAFALVDSKLDKGVNQVMQQQQLLSSASQEQIKQLTTQLAQSMQTEFSQAMQAMQRRMFWLAGVCGLSLLGTIGILLHLFV